MKPFRKLTLPAASLALLSLQGCSYPIIGTDSAKVASAIGHIEPSKKDTCETQKQIAAQSSRIDTIVQGKETVYKAPACDDKQPEPKTS